MRPLRRAVALCAVALAALPAGAQAARDLEIGIADDRILVSQPERAPGIVEEWRRLGVDVVRVHVRWVAVAPGDDEPLQPAGFQAADHLDPGYDWSFIDRAIDLLVAAGIEPILAVTGSGPLWSSNRPGLVNPRYKPSPAKFGEFARAVAARYGDRVGRYLVWNEPNIPGWLQPQFDCTAGPGRPCSPASPHVYRGLVRAAYSAIHGADPGSEVIAGTLAPRGGEPTKRNPAMEPLTFLRAFGCVDRRIRRIRTGACRSFVPARMDGFAYHPHGVLRAPDEPNPDPDEAAIADLPRLAATLDAVQDAGGFSTTDGLPVDVHLTEFGYQTDPPDPFAGVALTRQKRWLQHAAFVAWSDPRVRTLIHYEWEDDPVSDAGSGSRAFAGWQSGLNFADGRPKPALAAFRNPFFVRPGPTKAEFWGHVRGADGPVAVTVQRRLSSGEFGPWAAATTDDRGYFRLRKAITRPGEFRFSHVPTGASAPVLSAVQRVAPQRGATRG